MKILCRRKSRLTSQIQFPKISPKNPCKKMGKIGKSVSEQIPVDQPDSIPIAPITKVFPDRTNQPPTYIYKIQILLKMHES